MATTPVNVGIRATQVSSTAQNVAAFNSGARSG